MPTRKGCVYARSEELAGFCVSKAKDEAPNKQACTTIGRGSSAFTGLVADGGVGMVHDAPQTLDFFFMCGPDVSSWVG